MCFDSCKARTLQFAQLNNHHEITLRPYFWMAPSVFYNLKFIFRGLFSGVGLALCLHESIFWSDRKNPDSQTCVRLHGWYANRLGFFVVFKLAGAATIIDLFGFNSHLVQSRLKIDVTPIIAYTRLHPLVGKSYRRPIAVTQIRADLRCQQSSATA